VIRSFIFDAWSRLTRGERLDVVVEPVAPAPEVLAEIEAEAAEHQAKVAALDAERKAGEEFGVPSRVRFMSEPRVLERLVELTDSGVSPWDAAVSVFGGAGVAREASREGLSATLADQTRLPSVPLRSGTVEAN
jgi:xanthine/CO dehydrogenase XdhC/CoxF family maturation factor